jgi:hypothetical protein
VRDADSAAAGNLLGLGLEGLDEADGLQDVQLAVGHHGQAGGIVAAVLEDLESADQEVPGIFNACTSDNSAHREGSL